MKEDVQRQTHERCPTSNIHKRRCSSQTSMKEDVQRQTYMKEDVQRQTHERCPT